MGGAPRTDGGRAVSEPSGGLALITIPPQLVCAVDEDELPQRFAWLDALPGVIERIAAAWELELGEPYLPGGQVAWVAPVTDSDGRRLALKVGWRHREAEHEADALRVYDGDGAVRCYAESHEHADTTALLLERCEPGRQLNWDTPEPEQDLIVAEVLTRLWTHEPPAGHPFGSLQAICDIWAEQLEMDCALNPRGLDPGLARAGLEALRTLPATAERQVLLATDLHAGNILSSERGWLAIDPKPFVGDPAFDPVQHMLNCDDRLEADPAGLALRMAELTSTDPERVRLWLFARCAQEALRDLPARELARRLAP